MASITAERRANISTAVIKHYEDNPEHAERISQAQIQRFLDSIPLRIAEPTHRRCSRCTDTKPLEDFSSVRKRLKSGLTSIYPDTWCRECRRQDARARYARKKAADPEKLAAQRRRAYDREDPEKRRERSRRYSMEKRRKEGVPERGPRKPQAKSSGPTLPTAPLRELVETLDLSEVYLSPSLTRRLWDLRHGQEEFTLYTIDSFLSALGCPEKLNELYPIEEPKPTRYELLDPDGILKGVGA